MKSYTGPRKTTLQVADRLVDSIIERFWLLGEYPEAGRKADELQPGVKCFPAGKYLIHYRKARGGVDILPVFHGARDRKRAFQKCP